MPTMITVITWIMLHCFSYCYPYDSKLLVPAKFVTSSFIHSKNYKHLDSR